MWRSFGGWAALAALLMLGLAAIGLIGLGQAGRNDAGDRSLVGSERTTGERTSSPQGCRPGAPVDNIVADPAGTDDRHLVRFADNVFVGRVVGRVGYRPPSESTSPLPQSLFAVKVEKNIKGSLSGTVVVVQEGGCDPRYGRVVLVNNDPLLKPGQEAVFSTRKQSPESPHFIVGSNYGDVRVSTEEQEAKVVARFENARKELVPFDPSNPGSSTAP